MRRIVWMWVMGMSLVSAGLVFAAGTPVSEHAPAPAKTAKSEHALHAHKAANTSAHAAKSHNAAKASAASRETSQTATPTVQPAATTTK